MTEPTIEPMGKGWIIAIIVLLALLIIGVVLYLRMTAPLARPSGPATTTQTPGVSMNHACRVPYFGETGYMSNGVR